MIHNHSNSNACMENRWYRCLTVSLRNIKGQSAGDCNHNSTPQSASMSFLTITECYCCTTSYLFLISTLYPPISVDAFWGTLLLGLLLASGSLLPTMGPLGPQFHDLDAIEYNGKIKKHVFKSCAKNGYPSASIVLISLPIYMGPFSMPVDDKC